MKGQIKMFETVGVLIIFFILLMGGAIFYFGVQSSSLEQDRKQANEQLAFQTVIKALYLPELDCSFLVTQRDNCIDKIKAANLAQLIDEDDDAKLDYFSQFGNAQIVISQVYPKNEVFYQVLYSKIPEEFSDKLVTQNPILLYDSKKEIYAFGVIEVSVYG